MLPLRHCSFLMKKSQVSISESYPKLTIQINGESSGLGGTTCHTLKARLLGFFGKTLPTFKVV